MGNIRASIRRLPAHGWVLCVVLMLTLFVFGRVLEDYGPFDGWINFHSETPLDRKQLGPTYDYLPNYHTAPSRPDGGYFELYANTWTDDGRLGHCVFDAPYWPGGDPGLGSGNPLPPQVMRHEIRAIHPNIAFAVLAVGWLCWSALLTRHLLRGPQKGQGFDVIPPTSAIYRLGRANVSGRTGTTM